MRNLGRIALLLGSLGVVFGAQSVRVTNSGMSWSPSVTLPDSTPWNRIGASAQAMRWELRIHDFGSDWPPSGIDLGPLFLEKWDQGPIVWAETRYNADSIYDNGPNIPNCCAGRTDVLVRVQRDVANNQYTFEVCDTIGGNCQSDIRPITAYGPASWAGMAIGLNAEGYSTAFLRWFSSAVPVGTPIPIAGVTGDLADWEFEGNLADSSGHGLTMTGGTYTYVPTPSYPPVCNAGSQQSFRAGYGGHLDGSGSTPLDGGTTLSYVWQQVSGPSKVKWSSQSRSPVGSAPMAHTLAQPEITGLIAGSYTFQLTVTDGSGQSSQCTLDDGAVATDNNDVVITNNPAVDTLLGPMIRFGANPWPWFDNRHKAEADMQISTMDQYYGAYWDVADPGTITVTAGSQTVTGAGTSFTTLFCQGPSSPNTPSGVELVTWYPTGIAGQTGRRQIGVASCQSDTQLTLTSAWTNDVAGGSGLSYGDNSNRQAWSYSSAPANYYDNVAAFYALYYRSGIVDYLNAARKLADRFWECPQIDRGASFVINGSADMFPGRSVSAMGLVLRALDGRPDMWAGLHKIWDYFGHVYIGGSGPGYDNYDVVYGGGGLWDQREVAYHLAMISYCALYDTDPGYQSKCKGWVSGAIAGLFTQKKFPDGGWPNLVAQYYSWTTPPTTVTLTQGSTAVIGSGTSWSAGQFAIVAGMPPYMWFTNSSSVPASNADGDLVFYNPAFVDATHLMLDRPYGGVTGTHGWVLSTDSVDTPFLGYGSQPFMEGILGTAFDFAAKAIADTDPLNSALAHSYNVSVANWLRRYGYWPLMKSLYYGAQFVNCQEPIPEGNNPCTGDLDAADARVLNAESIRAVMAAYANNQDPGLKDFADLLFNAMWAKPNTCPTGSTICVADGTYVSAYDDGQSYMTGTPPTGKAPKYFGMAWGYSGLSAWPAIRIGGPQPSSTRIAYVGFDLRVVPGAAKVAVATTAPDGTVSQVQCSSSPCGVPAPGPPGDRLIQLQYLSGSGKILATGEASLVPTQ